MSNNTLHEISSLPMIMSDQDIVAAIDKILALAREDPTVPPTDLAETLADIMGRQSANYRPLDSSVCRRIESWAISAWAEQPPSC